MNFCIGVKSDYCDSMPCLNDGTCMNGTTNFTCKCSVGYEGITCSEGKNINTISLQPRDV